MFDLGFLIKLIYQAFDTSEVNQLVARVTFARGEVMWLFALWSYRPDGHFSNACFCSNRFNRTICWGTPIHTICLLALDRCTLNIFISLHFGIEAFETENNHSYETNFFFKFNFINVGLFQLKKLTFELNSFIKPSKIRMNCYFNCIRLNNVKDWIFILVRSTLTTTEYSLKTNVLKWINIPFQWLSYFSTSN